MRVLNINFVFLAIIGLYSSLVLAERPFFEPGQNGNRLDFNFESLDSLPEPPVTETNDNWMTQNIRTLINKHILKGKANFSLENREKVNTFISAIELPLRNLFQYSEMDPSAKDLALRNGDFPLKIEKQLDALVEALDKANVLDLFVNEDKEIDWTLLRHALCFNISNASEPGPHVAFQSALKKKKIVNEVLESIRKNKVPFFESLPLSPPRRTSSIENNKALADKILELAFFILLQEKIAQASDHNSPPRLETIDKNSNLAPPRIGATKKELRNALALDFPAEGCRVDSNFQNPNFQNPNNNNNVNKEDNQEEEQPVLEEDPGEEGSPKDPGAGTPPGGSSPPSLGSPSIGQGSKGGNLQMVPMSVFPGFAAYTGVAASANEDLISGAVSGIIASMSQITSGAAAGMAAIESSMQNFQQLMNSIGDKGDQMIPIQTRQNPQAFGYPMYNPMGAASLLRRRF